MKRIILVILIISLVFSAFGCARNDSGDDETVQSAIDIEVDKNEPDTQKEQQKQDQQPVGQQPVEQKPQDEQKQPEIQNTQKPPEKEQDTQKPEKPEPTPATVPDYKSFSCRKDSNVKWKQVRFTNNAGVTLQLELPSDWELEKSGDEFKVMRKGTQIGTMSSEKPQSPNGYYEYSSDYNHEFEILTTYQVNWYHIDGKDTVNKYFEFNTDQGTQNIRMCLSVNYTELDDNAAKSLLKSSLTVPRSPLYNFPKLATSNGSKKILLLGNSFINSSRINLFLDDMLRGSGYSLTSVSRGYAEVYKYAEDAAICEQIKRGDYAYVFMCGYYDNKNIDATKTFLDMCAVSGTNYVIFPAHNEGNNYIDATIAKYGPIPVLSWKNELDSLIADGIDRYTLCYNDGTFEHSNLYAGYVGAHMIYRAMFEKIPPKLVSAPLSQAQIDSVLVGYATSMHLPEEIKFSGTEYRI